MLLCLLRQGRSGLAVPSAQEGQLGRGEGSRRVLDRGGSVDAPSNRAAGRIRGINLEVGGIWVEVALEHSVDPVPQGLPEVHRTVGQGVVRQVALILLGYPRPVGLLDPDIVKNLQADDVA